MNEYSLRSNCSMAEASQRCQVCVGRNSATNGPNNCQDLLL